MGRSARPDWPRAQIGGRPVTSSRTGGAGRRPGGPDAHRVHHLLCSRLPSRVHGRRSAWFPRGARKVHTVACQPSRVLPDEVPVAARHRAAATDAPAVGRKQHIPASRSSHPAGDRASRGPAADPVAGQILSRLDSQFRLLVVDDGKLLDRRSYPDPLPVVLAVVSRPTQSADVGLASDGSATLWVAAAATSLSGGQVRANSLNCGVTSCTLFRAARSHLEGLGPHPD